MLKIFNFLHIMIETADLSAESFHCFLKFLYFGLLGFECVLKFNIFVVKIEHLSLLGIGEVLLALKFCLKLFA